MPAPALVLAIPLVAGVVLGVLASPRADVATAFAVVSTLAAVLALLCRSARTVVVACVAGALTAGTATGARAIRGARAPSLLQWYRGAADESAPVHVVGVLEEDASRGPQSVGLRVSIVRVRRSGAEEEVAGGARLSVAGALAADAYPEWRQGRTIEADAFLREPLDFRDPGVPSDRERLARDGIVLIGSVKSAALVTVTARAPWFAEAASATRAFVRRESAATVGGWSARSAGVVTAILIGDRSGLDVADERRLQDAGTYHVIAISGGNIALLTMMLVVAGRWLRLRRRWTAAGSIALLAFYGYLAGLAPSILRATLAGAIYLAGRIVDRRGAALNALAVAATIATAAAPLSVIDPGFILSFGATTAIVVAAARLLPERTRQHDATPVRRRLAGLARAAMELGVATLCAEIALAPVGAWLFGRVSLAGLLLNFVAIPLMSVVQVAGMTAIAVAPLTSAAGAGIGWIAHAATIGLLGSAKLVDVAPWLVRDVASPAWWLLAAWYGGWLVMLMPPPRRVRRWTAATLAVAGVLLLWGPSWASLERVAAPPPGWSRIVFLDVGQGDATVVWPAGGKPFLVDAGGVPGGAFDVGRRVTVPSAMALGVRRLSHLVLTHGDPDHIDGAAAVLRSLRPGDVWEGIPVPRHEGLKDLRVRAAAAGVPWREVRAGEFAQAGAATLRILNPPPADWERQKVRNDDSIVLDVRIGGVSIVLPGDITAAIEPAVASRLTSAPLTIVKAPHHGSGGSSSPAFVGAAHAAAVIFSAGARNPFGHPAPAVVDRYRAAGAEIFRTDQDGAVLVDTDGDEVVIWTWASHRRVRLAARTALSRPTADRAPTASRR